MQLVVGHVEGVPPKTVVARSGVSLLPKLIEHSTIVLISVGCIHIASCILTKVVEILLTVFERIQTAFSVVSHLNQAS